MPCSTCVRRGIGHTCYQGDDPSAAAKSHEASTAVKHPGIEEEYERGIGGTSGRGDAVLEQNEAKWKRRRTTSLTTGNDVHEDALANMHASQSDEAQLERMLIKARNQINALTGIVSDSSTSIEALIRAIQVKSRTADADIHGSGLDGLITWRDVADYLPSVVECAELIRFYFEDLAIYIQISRRSAIEADWHALLDGPGLDRNRTRILCTIMAMADGTSPPHGRIRKHTMKDHDRWLRLMGDPLLTSFDAPVDNTFERVTSLGLLAIYNLYMGRHDRLWECMGAAIRRGYIIGLFDERHKAWQRLSNIDKEYRRRLAWYMVSLERIQAFMRQLPFALHPDNVHLCLPSFAPDDLVVRGHIAHPSIRHTFPITLPDGRLQTNMSANDGRVVKFVQIELFAVCQDFLMRFHELAPSQRYSRAIQIDQLLDRTLLDGLYGTGVATDELDTIGFLSSQTLDRCTPNKMLNVNLFVSTIFFLRCFITRRFLVDEQAPSRLRFVSLTYAQGIVSTIPSLVRMVKEGEKPIQMTWNANHLLCAATAFAVVILGRDSYAGIDTVPARVAVPSDQTAGQHPEPYTFPRDQVSWLAENIFSTLECLTILVDRGNAAAVVAKRLLERICGSQDELLGLYRKRFPHQQEDVFRTPAATNHVRVQAGATPAYSPWPPARSPSISVFSPSNPSHFPTSSSATGLNHPPTTTSSSSSSGPRLSLPPIQPFPPSMSTMQRASFSNVSSAHAASHPSPGGPTYSPPLIARLVNASSLLDAIVMDNADLDLMSEPSNANDILASILQGA